MLRQAAAENDLPEEFFTRLIWQESRFDPMAVSPAGAQGIAQFMPRTAMSRGLTNAFEPHQALHAAARYLRELRATLGGNLGLAAAAYNAGLGQVEGWLAGRATLPSETASYVRIITGRTAEDWVSQPLRPQTSDTSKGADCVELATLAIDGAPPWLASVSMSKPLVVGPSGFWSDGRVLVRKDATLAEKSSVAGSMQGPACSVSVRRPALARQSDKRDQSGCDAGGPGRLIILRTPGG